MKTHGANPAASGYESDELLQQYLLFHYGEAKDILPWPEGPANALDFPKRCAEASLQYLKPKNPQPLHALDIGCAVGRSTFELARSCNKVIGIDFSQSFIDAAKHMKQNGSHPMRSVQEGDHHISLQAHVPSAIDRSRVEFMQGDACALPEDLGTFDLILAANLLCRLPSPRTFLDSLPRYCNRGAVVCFTTPATWMEAYTPKENWLCGMAEDGSQHIDTFAGLSQVMNQLGFTLLSRNDMPFLIREHRRKYQWSMAEFSAWQIPG